MSNPSNAFWVRVRTLGEFVFCGRAGVLSSLQAGNEEEPEYDQPNLDFLPQYSVAVIEEQVAIHLVKLRNWVLCAAFAVAGGAAALWFDVRLGVVAAAVLLFVISRFLSRELRSVMTLADYRRQAQQAEPKEPSSPLSGPTPVNWWEMLKAGFDSIRLKEILRDETSKLAGKPWRVLRKGSLRIPVIKLEAEKYEAERFWVYPQHEIRLAAYAHLLSACEGGESPYGIALFGDSFDGIAIPITEELRTQVRVQLEALCEALRQHSGGMSPEPPKNPNICLGCPFGSPAPVDAALKNADQKVYGVTGRDGVLYHSECGDQFEWTPAHQVAKRKGLVPPGG